MFVVTSSENIGIVDESHEIVFDIKYENIEYKAMLKRELGYNSLPKLVIDGSSYIYDIKKRTFTLEVMPEFEEEVFTIVEKIPIFFEDCLISSYSNSEVYNCSEKIKKKWVKERLKKLDPQYLNAVAQFIVRDTGEITDIKIISTNNESYNDYLVGMIKDLNVARIGKQKDRKVNVLVMFNIDY
jgi:hypothetical protein